MFCEELALLLEHGMVLGDALEILADERNNDDAASRVFHAVQSGSSLNEAVCRVFSSLPPWMCSVLRATEEAAIPQTGLALLAEYMRNEEQWKSNMKRSLSYPMVLLFATILIGMFVARLILPTLAGMVETLGGALPLTTRIALVAGSVMGSPYAISLWILVMVSAGWVWLGRGETSEYLIRIPLVKRLALLSEAWRFFSINGILLSAGMPLHDALQRSAAVLHSKTLSRGAQQVAELVQGGTSLETAIREMTWLPRRTPKVLAVAVSAGSVARGFTQMMTWVEGERNDILQAWNTWLPVLVLCAATVLIGLLAYAILMPAFAIDLGP